MKSRTSLCNVTLLKKNVRRFAPLWGMFAFVLLLIGPFYLLRNGYEISHIYGEFGKSSFLRNYFSVIGDAGCPILFFYALLCAAVCFKYLHKTKSAYMMHAFPMTRDCQFVTNLISGLLFFAVPTLAMGVLDYLVIVLNGGREAFALIPEMLAKWGLQYLFFYGAAVFCMVLSGRTVIAVLSYGALNVIGWFLPAVIQESLVEPMFAGYVGHDFTALSPIIRLSDSGTALNEAYVYVYAAIGVLLTAAAWLHYRLRHMERAGDAMAYGWAKPVFAVLFALCFGLGFGNILALIFSSELAGYVFWLLFGVCLGWVFAQMMLRRTVRVWKGKHWAGLAALLGVLLCLVLCLRYDVLGWQKRVPDLGQISSVEVSTHEEDWRGAADVIEITKPEDVELVRAMHGKAIASNAKSPKRGGIFSSYSFYGDGRLYLTYHLKNGGTLKRAYYVGDLNTLLPEGCTLYGKAEYALQYYSELIPVSFEYAELMISGKYLPYQDPEEEDSQLHLPKQDFGALRDAILEDARTGRLPISNQFTDNGKESDWYYELTIVRSDGRHVVLELPTSASGTLAVFGEETQSPRSDG